MIPLLERLRPQLSRQLTGDVMWNLVSFAVMGVAGIALNFLIATFYDASTLGVFNQVYTIYILLSQVAVAGIHLSVLKYVAAEDGQADHILAGALVATVLVALPVSIAGYLGGDLAGRVLESPPVGRGIRVASVGVFFFALNKTLLALHNGLARLRPFAVFQASRFVLMIAALLVLAWLLYPGADLPLLFTIAEGILFLALLAFTLRRHSVRLTPEGRDWARRHFLFGGRALWGNLLADVNTRVDILILGFFTADRVVGIYSFAALVAEGFAQLAIVFRNVVNPRLARYRVERTTQELEVKLRQGIRMAYAYTVPLGIVLVLAFPIVVSLLGVDAEYHTGWSVFAVLMAGITASMGYSAFQMLLNQGGYPGYQSLFFALTFASNVGLNIALIPVMGMLGSALATAISFVLSVLYLRALVWRAMAVRM